MGSTQEIAEAITAHLCVAGLSVDLYPAEDAPDPIGYRAVVLGSAVYLRRWRRPALRYLRRHTTTLRGLPVWLFQSGPCGEHDASEGIPTPRAVRRLIDRTDAFEPVTFGGRLDPARAAGALARWLSSSKELRGDFRDWVAIRGWARGIAGQLGAGEPHLAHEAGPWRP
ncbi:menaquinone-dependent protoporphyrinogen oxidase [Pseudonocardia eucalypti]|nr:menaquinone-dependent protoporphyrinogen oxidase [Pseudonocardia eucalypti]